MGFDGLTKLGGAWESFPDGGEPPVFYYSRTHRLEGAPKNVRDYHAGKITPVSRGFFRALTATPGLRLTFTTMIGMFVLVVFLTARQDNSRAVVAGIPVSLGAAEAGRQVHVGVDLGAPERVRGGIWNRGADRVRKATAGYDGEPVFVRAEVRFFDDQETLLTTRTLETLYAGQNAFLRTSIDDYDIIKVEVRLFVGGETATLKKQIARGSRY
ncbi:MAG: hypothetical protein LBS64_06075 [Spirochaetaceae bacterium]|nr:hypothetical protein [Spirochaetaceae bacterium]